MAVEIRDATEDDAAFLSWVMLAASRSHLPRGVWEFVADLSGDQAQELLRRVCLTDDAHICHHSMFFIAEVDGTPASAMCGFDADAHGWEAVFRLAAPFAVELGATLDDDFMQRVMLLGSVSLEHEPGAWIVENVATLPEYRRQGLLDLLFKQILDRGRKNGHTHSQIGVLIGNDRARNAYLKQGFEFREEKRNPELGEAFGSPGGERLVMPL